MILYHGSNQKVDNIDLGKSRPSKDFGLAFRVHDYDIVYGPIANDRIGRQIFNFQSGYIDFETFLKRIQYSKGITYQWAFCTEKAIKNLQSL